MTTNLSDFIRGWEGNRTQAYFQSRKLGFGIRKKDFLEMYRDIKGISDRKPMELAKYIPIKYRKLPDKVLPGTLKVNVFLKHDISKKTWVAPLTISHKSPNRKVLLRRLKSAVSKLWPSVTITGFRLG